MPIAQTVKSLIRKEQKALLFFSLLGLLFMSGAVIHWFDELGLPLPPWIGTHVAPSLRAYNGYLQDLKFRIRGVEAPKHKIVIVGIDDESLSVLGRWPWDRVLTAELVDSIFQYQPKSVGLDILFSEAQDPVSSSALRDELSKRGLAKLLDQYNSDRYLSDVVRRHRQQLSAGWKTDNTCVPRYSSAQICQVGNALAAGVDENDSLGHRKSYLLLKKFALGESAVNPAEAPAQVPEATSGAQAAGDVSAEDQNSTAWHFHVYTPNIPEISAAAQYAGSLNAFTDQDGLIRSQFIVLQNGTSLFPTLALSMLVQSQKVETQFAARQTQLSIVDPQTRVPLLQSQNGAMRINYRGPSKTFATVSARDVLDQKESVEILERGGKPISKSELFKDAWVFVGVTARAATDIRATPFEAEFSGLELHANVLDNLLANDGMTPFPRTPGQLIVLFLGIILTTLVVYLFTLNVRPLTMLWVSLAFFMAYFGAEYYLLQNHVYFPSIFVIAYLTLFFALKYVFAFFNQSQQKRNLAQSFSRYVSPDIVNEIVKSGGINLTTGAKRELTVLFSDLRGFSGLSEKMDPDTLTKFLNKYFSLMTAAIHTRKGTVDKFIGDAIMAFWNAPVELVTPNFAALSAALDMLKNMDQNREEFLTEFGVHVQLGIGINCGSAFVGSVGSSSNTNYTAIGDEVNIASRLEGLCKQYQCAMILSARVIEKVAEEVGKEHAILRSVRPLDRVVVKGRARFVEIFEAAPSAWNVDELTRWGLALAGYRAGQFAEAKSQFLSFKGDPVASLFADRCDKFALEPPSNWQGIWHVDSK